MRYIITTLGRIERQETLENLPEQIADKVELWVQEHEYENSCRYYDGVHALPAHIRTLGPTRQWLVDHYWGEKILLMDDDLTLYWRQDPEDWHLTIPPPENVVHMFEEIEAVLDEYAHVGVSGREGQNRELAYGVECTRYMRMLGYNTALWPQDRSVRMDRVSGMSDFDTNMQLLRSGRKSYVFYRWAQGQRSTQQPGGCTLERTRESHFAEVRTMCELHPGLVVPRKKLNVSGGAFGQRDEVTVAWKMALGWDERAAEQRRQSPLAQALARVSTLEEELRASEAARATLEASSQATLAKLAAAEARLREYHSAVPAALDRRTRVYRQEELNGADDQHP